jgi:hypothetical protein
MAWRLPAKILIGERRKPDGHKFKGAAYKEQGESVMQSTMSCDKLLKSPVQGLLLTALLLLAPTIRRADEFDDRKNHLQQLMDQADTLKD